MKNILGEYTTYIISKGETLWSIAKQYDGDTRKIIDYIREDNDIKDCGSLKAGQEILLRDEY